MLCFPFTLSVYLTVNCKLVLMMFITNALRYANRSGEIYIICRGFEMEEKAICVLNFTECKHLCTSLAKEGHLNQTAASL